MRPCDHRAARDQRVLGFANLAAGDAEILHEGGFRGRCLLSGKDVDRHGLQAARKLGRRRGQRVFGA